MKFFKFFRITHPQVLAPVLALLAASTCGVLAPPAQAQPSASPLVSRLQSKKLARLIGLRPGGISRFSFIQRGGSPSAALVQSEPTLRKSVVGTGPLRFTLSGFTPQQTADYNAYIRLAYQKMVMVYGDPAPSQRGRTVRIIFTSEDTDGVYDPNDDPKNSRFNTITYNPLPSDAYADDFAKSSGECDATCQATSARLARDYDKYNLTRQMLRAFRGSQLTDFDAWDIGHSDAAALVVFWMVLEEPRDFNPSLYVYPYLLPSYDFNNRPELGNKYFYTLPNQHSKDAPPSSTLLLETRYGMAQAAWLKV